MLEAGAEGYLSKNCNNYDLFRQIIEDRHHGRFISPELLTRQMTDNNIN
jgi:DNA-binding NarL/FixJ family response regulator